MAYKHGNMYPIKRKAEQHNQETNGRLEIKENPLAVEYYSDPPRGASQAPEVTT